METLLGHTKGSKKLCSNISVQQTVHKHVEARARAQVKLQSFCKSSPKEQISVYIENEAQGNSGGTLIWSVPDYRFDASTQSSNYTKLLRCLLELHLCPRDYT